MTGFDAYLDSLPSTRFLVNNLQNEYVSLMMGYRRAKKRLRMPVGGEELKRIRTQGLRPVCRVLVTADEYLAGMAEANDDSYPLVIGGHTAYDFSSLFGLDVLYVMPDSMWGFEIAYQIAESWPSSLSLVWPGTDHEEVMWS